MTHMLRLFHTLWTTHSAIIPVMQRRKKYYGQGQALKAKAWTFEAKAEAKQVSRPRPRHMMRAKIKIPSTSDRIGNELNVDCFFLDIHLLIYSLTYSSTFLDEGWRQQTTTPISFFSIVLDLVTSPLVECVRSQSTLQCRVSTVFSVCLDAVALP